MTCANEEVNPTVSREYHLLRRLIDIDENFIEVRELGEDLAMNVIKRWMTTACRDLNNFQWRLVANAIAKCSLPIFVKLGEFIFIHLSYVSSNIGESLKMISICFDSLC